MCRALLLEVGSYESLFLHDDELRTSVLRVLLFGARCAVHLWLALAIALPGDPRPGNAFGDHVLYRRLRPAVG